MRLDSQASAGEESTKLPIIGKPKNVTHLYKKKEISQTWLSLVHTILSANEHHPASTPFHLRYPAALFLRLFRDHNHDSTRPRTDSKCFICSKPHRTTSNVSVWIYDPGDFRQTFLPLRGHRSKFSPMVIFDYHLLIGHLAIRWSSTHGWCWFGIDTDATRTRGMRQSWWCYTGKGSENIEFASYRVDKPFVNSIVSTQKELKSRDRKEFGVALSS